MDAQSLKETAAREIDSLATELRRISLEIHAHPEVGYEEFAASALLSGTLEAAGFEVGRGTAPNIVPERAHAVFSVRA